MTSDAMDADQRKSRRGPRYIGPSSQRWPDGRPLCGGDRGADPETGEHRGYCRKTAGSKTDHFGVGSCDNHAGCTPNGRAAAQKVQAAEILERYGTPRQIDPRDGLIEEYWRTAGAVAYCEQRVHALPDADLVWGLVEETDASGGQNPGVTSKHKAAVNVWLQLYQAERKKFSDLGVEILRLGLEARRDAAADRHSLQMAGMVRLFVAELGLSPEQQSRVPAALAAAVASVTGAAVEGEVA